MNNLNNKTLTKALKNYYLDKNLQTPPQNAEPKLIYAATLTSLEQLDYVKSQVGNGTMYYKLTAMPRRTKSGPAMYKIIYVESDTIDIGISSQEYLSDQPYAHLVDMRTASLTTVEIKALVKELGLKCAATLEQLGYTKIVQANKVYYYRPEVNIYLVIKMDDNGVDMFYTGSKPKKGKMDRLDMGRLKYAQIDKPTLAALNELTKGK